NTLQAVVVCVFPPGTPPPARRLSAGAVPGRWGGLLGAKDPTGRLLLLRHQFRPAVTFRCHCAGVCMGELLASQRASASISASVKSGSSGPILAKSFGAPPATLSAPAFGPNLFTPSSHDS